MSAQMNSMIEEMQELQMIQDEATMEEKEEQKAVNQKLKVAREQQKKLNAQMAEQNQLNESDELAAAKAKNKAKDEKGKAKKKKVRRRQPYFAVSRCRKLTRTVVRRRRIRKITPGMRPIMRCRPRRSPGAGES